MKRHLAIAAAAALLLCACSRKEQPEAERNVLYTYGQEELTLEEVTKRIPRNLPEEDSAAMFNAIVREWLEGQMLEDLAEQNILDLNEIDRLTELYRRRLIIDEYKRSARRDLARRSPAQQKEIRAWYAAHKEELLLPRPLIKGIYITLPADAEQLPDVRRWIRNASPQSVDYIEKYGLRGAMQYEYFLDRWIDFDLIEAQLPQRVDDPDRFVAENRDYECSDSKTVHLLRITEALPSGEVMPEDYASAIVAERIAREKGEDFEEQLFRDLERQALAEGKLKKSAR